MKESDKLKAKSNGLLKKLKVTVRDGKEYQSRWSFLTPAGKPCYPEWGEITYKEESSLTLPVFVPNPDPFSTGKLIVVERTYTERIIKIYDIQPNGRLKCLTKKPKPDCEVLVKISKKCMERYE